MKTNNYLHYPIVVIATLILPKNSTAVSSKISSYGFNNMYDRLLKIL